MKPSKILQKETPKNKVDFLEEVEAGNTSTVYKINCRKKIYYLKMYTKGSAEIENFILKELSKVTHVVPRVVGASDRNEKSFILLEEAVGEEIYKNTSNFANRKLLNSFGKELAKIHSIHTFQFGKIEKIQNNMLFGTSILQEKTISAEFRNDLITLLNFELVDRHTVYFLEKIVLENLSLSITGNPRLAHADLSMNHVFVQDNRVSGIIDFGNARSSDIHYDFAIINLEWNCDINAIIEGYMLNNKNEFSIRKMNYFTILAGVSRISWCLRDGMLSPNSKKWYLRMLGIIKKSSLMI
ncbi:aminoglycoside phosphotransferase family protein [Ekhidna sp.]|uniref:aminoglycoside phosphotransferase family protein n=1 Tax=Ekhidna sp. TaxID=2608089 RepID=UPI0032ECF92B